MDATHKPLFSCAHVLEIAPGVLLKHNIKES